MYLRYYEFKEDVTQVAQFGTNQTDNYLRDGGSLTPRSAATLRSTLSPLTCSARTITSSSMRLTPNKWSSLPRYFYPWDAKLHVDVLTLVLQEAK